MTLVLFKEPVPSVVDVCRSMALEGHGGDKNKHDGELYLLHVNRVAIGARTTALMFGVDPELAEAVAWLHDLVEDTPVTLSDIRSCFVLAGQPTEVIDQIIEAVDLLTKPSDRKFTLDEYYAAIRENPLARAVKLADMYDNFRRNHKIRDEATRNRMGKKYSKGMDYLAPTTRWPM